MELERTKNRNGRRGRPRRRPRRRYGRRRHRRRRHRLYLHCRRRMTTNTSQAGWPNESTALLLLLLLLLSARLVLVLQVLLRLPEGKHQPAHPVIL